MTNAASLTYRARTQGRVDLAVALAGATGGLSSGLIVASTSYATLAAAGGVLALAIFPATLRSAQGKATGDPTTSSNQQARPP